MALVPGGNLEILANQLWQVGIENIFINGSFVEDKDHPNDMDGYFECKFEPLVSGELVRTLNNLDPYKVWTLDPGKRINDPLTGKRQLPMWHRYRIELYPHYGQASGIRDQFGNELPFPSAFRLRRNSFQPKGIIKLIRSTKG